MMKVVYTLLVLIFTTELHAQTKLECNIEKLEVYLNDSDTTGTNIRATPAGTIKSVIKNNVPDELFIMFEVCKMQNGWLLVKTVNNPEVVIGWIHNSVVTTNLAAYSEPIPIFVSPNKSIKPFDMVSTEQQVKVLESLGLFTKIEYVNSDGIKTIGFVENYNLCGSPYTTCN